MYFVCTRKRKRPVEPMRSNHTQSPLQWITVFEDAYYVFPVYYTALYILYIHYKCVNTVLVKSV